MKKFFKVLLKILIILSILLLINCIIHHIMLKMEETKIIPNGNIVEVNGHDMHVYIKGEANSKPTLVFLSGSATVAPVYDFKSLYAKLAESYKIVVIEKAGYGYSETCDVPRDVDTMVAESRQALELTGIKGEYILLPHSMSGLEALYWAQKFPKEVNGIIGLDMALPDHYMNFDFDRTKRMIAAGKVATFLGLHRTLSFTYPLSDIALTDDEIIQQKYLMYKNAVNNIFYIEGTYTYENALKVKDLDKPNVNMLLLLSDGSETSDDWLSVSEKYANNIGVEVVYYDCGHYIHYYETNSIVENIKTFIEQ